LWQNLDRPCSTKIFETALRFTENRARAYGPASAVLVHGDAHSRNVLRTLENQSRFKLIDPDGVFAEPACDLGVLLREWPDELLADPVKVGWKRCELLARLTGTDPIPTWEWGFIQVVSTGLLFLRIGQTLPGQKLLTIAEAWARA
jgi:streptomycin 6-kinase